MTKEKIYNITKVNKEDNYIESSSRKQLYNVSTDPAYLNILSTLANDGYDDYSKVLENFKQE